MKYTFGTSNTAAERLGQISKFFNPLSIKFIQKYLKAGSEKGLDIGCGPGFTTDMLAEAGKITDLYGFDISASFLAIAKKRFPQYQFICHDITQFPFPVTADLGYARFELSHLRDPVSLINKWAKELKHNGMLFVEELEDIKTETMVFKEYLAVNNKLIANQGAELFVGQKISAGEFEFKVRCNEKVELCVEEWRAASWFYPNTISIWKNDAFISTLIDHDAVQRISDSIKEILALKENRGNTFWYMRRILIEKV